MDKIKKPKWDKPKHGTASSGSYGTDTIIISPPDHFGVGMTAYVRYQSIKVKTKVTKPLNNSSAEAVITEIDSKTKTIGNLSVGDCILINLRDLEYLGTTISS
ncbi:hypothetical protein KA005_50045 [bacterium]|nr:hypothetical protein [bacterium]